ncbi:MAG TPA: ParA family protein [Thermotogaceae bacterium]|nr:ParA family protein [Thermotogaceae bacterium]
MMAKVIVFSNRKGGTGKTTLAFNIAAILSERGRTLLIDFDSQAHSTIYYGLQPQSINYGIYESLVEFVKNGQLKKEVVVDTKSFHLIPANQNLAAFDLEFANLENKEGILKDFLLEFDSDYDYILIDTPPNLGLTTLNALTAAQYLVIPVKADFLSLAGLAQIMDIFYKVNSTLNPSLILLGIVPVMFVTRTKMSKEFLEQVTNIFGKNLVFHPLRSDVKVMESSSYALPVHLYSPNCRAAVDLRKIAEQILWRMKNEKGIG